MVMANNNELDVPSAQHVGREFVRQYYTLLNEAPYHLHRFYSHNSCFVHGGVEKPGEEQPPVMGQSEIHKKILSLNFRDCHAKIRQVDSQATVGQGVVVQVTGELSNNGEPMRRFMQTFVLAPQSPKKYYVHNDVFRYQDEVFLDEEDEEEEVEQPLPETVNGGQSEEQAPEAVSTSYEQSQTLSNGTVHEEDVDPTSVAAAEDTFASEPEQIEADTEAAESSEEPIFEKPEAKPVEEPEPEQIVETTKTFSWAAITSKNTQASTVSAPPVQMKTMPTRMETKGDSTSSATVASPPSAAQASSLSSHPPQPQRGPKVSKENRFVERDRTSIGRGEEGDGDSISGRRGGGVKYPDSHQLFVGNLPHNITERELKVFFGQYGNVVELRINTKSSGGKLPNFGFVVFDAPEPVQEILKQKPIKYNGEHRLNVEEKKPRGGDGRPGGGRGAPRGGGAGGLGRGSAQFGSTGRGGMKGGFSRPADGERRGVGATGPPRGSLNQPPQRR